MVRADWGADGQRRAQTGRIWAAAHADGEQLGAAVCTDWVQKGSDACRWGAAGCMRARKGALVKLTKQVTLITT